MIVPIIYWSLHLAVSYPVLLWNYTSERWNRQFVEKKQCVYLWDTSFGYARRRCVEYFTRLECLAAPIHRLFSLTRSRIHRSVCSPAVVTKFWMCKEVCNFCSNVSISLLSKFIAFNLKRFDEEIRTINEQHVSIYRIDCFLIFHSKGA